MIRVRKRIFYYDTVYLPTGLPKVFVKRAIDRIKSDCYWFVEFDYLEYVHVVHLKLEGFSYGDNFLEKARIVKAANELRRELHKMNELYLLLKDVYGIEPKKASRWARFWHKKLD